MLDKEGTALAPEFLSQGYTLFVLSYRLPSPAEEENINKTFIDAISAMLYIRKMLINGIYSVIVLVY